MNPRLTLIGAVLCVAAACGGPLDGSSSEGHASALKARPVQPFVQPPGTVAVDFVVDDAANRVYQTAQLKVKGSFLYDEQTRLLTPDWSWSGASPGAAPLSGFPTLHDDGPWTEGGHEPVGAKAQDHVWGVTVFATPPQPLPWWPGNSDSYEFGLIDVGYQTALGNGWIWKGPNGHFSVPSGASASIATGVTTLERFGHTDLRLSIDTGHLSPSGPWSTSTVKVKSSAWGWGEVALHDDGGGVFSVALSTLVGEHGLLPRTGLFNPGDEPEFVYVLGGVEYLGWTVTAQGYWTWGALTDGVTAALRPEEGSGSYPAPIALATEWGGWHGYGNTFIRVPGCFPSRKTDVPACGREGNRLTDPGFEGLIAGAEGGWNLFGASFSSARARRGAFSMRVPAFYGVNGSYQQLAAAPGSRWRLQGYGLAPVALQGSPAFGLVQISFFDAAGNDLGTVETAGGPDRAKTSNRIDSSTPAGQWTALDTGTATAPAGTASVQAFTLYVDFSGYGGQEVDFDDLMLTTDRPAD